MNIENYMERWDLKQFKSDLEEDLSSIMDIPQKESKQTSKFGTSLVPQIIYKKLDPTREEYMSILCNFGPSMC